MDISILAVVLALIALVSPVWLHFLSKRKETLESYEHDLDKVAKFIYSIDDPDVLRELAILTDVRRLLLHLELTEGRQRLAQGHS